MGLRAINCLVPDFVLDECQEPTREQILSAGAREEVFAPREIHELITLRARHRDLSLADASVFLLARREAGIVLTRDKPLE